MKYKIVELTLDNVIDWKYGVNCFMPDEHLSEEVTFFQPYYGLVHDKTLLWTVLKNQKDWVATRPITTDVFEYYLKRLCSLEDKEPKDINDVDDCSMILSYYLEGGCGGPGEYYHNEETSGLYVYLSEGSAIRVAEDMGLRFVSESHHRALYTPDGEDSKYTTDGISHYSRLGYSVPLGYGNGMKEWGAKGLTLPLSEIFSIQTQGYEHAYLRPVVHESKVELI